MEKSILNRRKSISYQKWGYFFIAPFFIVYIIFSLFPLLSTFYNSFFENYRVGLNQIGPNFIGFQNYIEVFTNSELPSYALNTLIIWLYGFVPQILVSFILALLFTSRSLKIKFQNFFKRIIFFPNLIMAAAFAMLFFTLFSDSDPVNNILIQSGLIDIPIRYLAYVDSARGLIAAMNFLMWYGNTTILLMAGIMGIDENLLEAARIDGAGALRIFTRIIFPLLLPIMAFVIITSLIGGLQMFDVPQILSQGQGSPDRSTMTMIMYLNRHLFSKNFGLGGAVSTIIFVVTAALSIAIYYYTMKNYNIGDKKGKKGK